MPGLATLSLPQDLTNKAKPNVEEGLMRRYK